MGDRIMEVTIVGGGDIGLLTALVLDRLNPDLAVRVIDDFDTDPPQVGKSTYKRMTSILHDVLDIDEQTFIAAVKPVWKGSVYFRDWCGKTFHFPFDTSHYFPGTHTQRANEFHYYLYSESCNREDHRTRGEEIVAQRKSPMYYDPGQGRYRKYEFVAYHLNLKRFNAFLRKLCRDRSIPLIDDAVTEVRSDGRHVERVSGTNGEYEADLFVDATGFNRVLKSTLDDEFFAFDFPLDRAVNTRIERPLEDVLPATTIDSGSAGWFWQIDTYDVRDIGYVYASEFIDEESAVEEFIDHCDGEVSQTDVGHFSFSSGYYPRAWQGNCVTIGNAEGFVEPLQSTGLTANAEAAVVLSNMLSSHGAVNDAGIRRTYNAWVRRLWHSIYDFICLHYKFSDGDTAFWDSVQELDLSERNRVILRHYDENGFMTTTNPLLDEPGVTDVLVFDPADFYLLLRNLDLPSSFYEEGTFGVSDGVRRQRDSYYRDVSQDVDGYLTHEEVYFGIPELAGSD